MKPRYLTLGLVALSVAFFVSLASVSAGIPYNDSQTSTVVVNIADQTYINIDPSDFYWTGVAPGDVGDGTTEVHGYTAIQVENIGSNNISNIWFNATYPSIRPFATGSHAYYDSGNFVVIGREGEDKYYFPNRVDYNESRSLVYLKDPGGNRPPDAGSYHYGRFRNTTKEYFWFVDKTGSAPADYCNETGTTFYLGDAPHTQGDSGSIDFSSCSGNLVSEPGTNVDSCRVGTLTNVELGSPWAWADVRVGTENYTVAVNYACDKTMWIRWNMDAPGARGSKNAEMFWNSSVNGALVPGNSTVANMRVYIPYGVHMGNISSGTITVLANDIEYT